MFKNEIAGIYNTGKDETDDDYIKIGNVKTFAGMELGINNDTNEAVGVITGGSHDKDTHDIYLNDLYINGNTEVGLGVFGHEIGHAIYGSDEDLSKYLGNTFTGAYTDGLWINGKDTGLGNWNIDNNSSYVIGNTMDWSRVENRDNQVVATVGCTLGGPVGCGVGVGIDWALAGTVATGVVIGGITLYNSDKDNSTRQEPKNEDNSSGNNGDNNGGDKDPNFCKNNPDKCNFLEKLTEKIKDFLGDEARQQNTPKGNKQFISKDNDRIIRFDIDGEKNPHINIEIRSEGINEHIFFR